MRVTFMSKNIFIPYTNIEQTLAFAHFRQR